MEHFSYSFAASMMHSLWQTGLLLGSYFIVVIVFKNSSPFFKRNLLFAVLAAQLFLTLITFIFYWSSSFESLEQHLTDFLQLPFLQQSWLRTYTSWIFYGYSTVVFFKISSYFYHWIQVKKSYSSGLIKPSAECRIFTADKVFHLGIKRNVSIWLSENVTTPVTFGFFKPMILLPVALLNQLSLKETEALIVHEIAHIKSNDYLLNLLLIATETMYFFNPFVKIIAKKIRLEREKNCDVQVLDFNYDHISYADALLKTARLQKKLNVFQLAATSGQAQLLQRIHFFSTTKNLKGSGTNKTPYAACFLLLVVLFNVFTLLKLTNNMVAENVSALNVIVPGMMNFDETDTDIVINKPPVTAQNNIATPKESRRTATRKPISKAQDIYTKPSPILPSSEFAALPVALVDEQPTLVHDVLINEESSTGKQVTKAYRVKLKDGRWIAEPLWMTAEKLPAKNSSDTLQPKADSTYKLMPPAM